MTNFRRLDEAGNKNVTESSLNVTQESQ